MAQAVVVVDVMVGVGKCKPSLPCATPTCIQRVHDADNTSKTYVQKKPTFGVRLTGPRRVILEEGGDEGGACVVVRPAGIRSQLPIARLSDIKLGSLLLYLSSQDEKKPPARSKHMALGHGNNTNPSVNCLCAEALSVSASQNSSFSHKQAT